MPQPFPPPPSPRMRAHHMLPPPRLTGSIWGSTWMVLNPVGSGARGGAARRSDSWPGQYRPCFRGAVGPAVGFWGGTGGCALLGRIHGARRAPGAATAPKTRGAGHKAGSARCPASGAGRGGGGGGGAPPPRRTHPRRPPPGSTSPGRLGSGRWRPSRPAGCCRCRPCNCSCGRGDGREGVSWWKDGGLLHLSFFWSSACVWGFGTCWPANQW